MVGWYLYTALNSSTIIVCIVLLFVYRKYISKGRRLAIVLFLLAPFIGITLQIMNIGISFIQMGIAIGGLGILVSYLIDWIVREKNEGDTTEDKRRLWLIECSFGIMLLFMSSAIVSCIVSINRVSNKNSEQSSIALAYMVSETIDSALSEPVNVSRTMAQSNAIRDALTTDNLEGSVEEQIMISYLKRIKDEYGYQMIFVASEKTKAYYTYDGLSRYMMVESDPRDAWYNEYKARNVKFELNIDEDKDNDMKLAVFVNMEVRDDDGNLIGVCGVAMSVESIMDILLLYENNYNLDIAMIDMEGIVQMDSNRDQIGQTASYDIVPLVDSDDVVYEKIHSHALMAKYIKGLDWYLVLEDKDANKIDVFTIVLPSLVIFILGVLLMIVILFSFGVYEKKRSCKIRNSKLLSQTDRLTGVWNRNAFEVFQKEFKPDEVSSIQVVMMDINGLKATNDNLGHLAGDELIVGTAKCIKDSLGGCGEIYRIGGDEFVFISYENRDTLLEKLAKLKEITTKWSGDLVTELSISSGYSSSDEEGVNLSELLKVADNRMYEDKKEYYRKTGKDRRMS